jgi:hypothetical protein
VATDDRQPRHIAPADVEGALAELGIEVWRSSDDEVTAYCPGHLERTGREERNPSWSVNRATGLHNCYSCGFKGTFTQLVMYRMFPNDVFRAARWLRQFGHNLAKAADFVDWAEREQTVDAVPQTMVPETRLAMYDEVPDWALDERHISREAANHYGLRWDSKHQAWIIPVRTPSGDLAGWQKKWAKRRRFINEPKDMLKSLCLFGFDVFPVGEPAVLLESPLDVPRLYTAGFEGGVSSYGAAVSLEQMKLIEAVTDEVVVALDNDADGRLHAEELRTGKWERGKMVQRPFARGMHVRFFSYERAGDAKDIGAMDQDGDIEVGLYEAQHSSVARLGTEDQKRNRRGLHRRAQALPSRTRRADGRPRAVPADRRRGNRQDPHDHRRPRGAA